MSKSKNESSAKAELIEVLEPPKIPNLNFGKRPSMFMGGGGARPKSFVAQPVRITQHKGGTSGGK